MQSQYILIAITLKKQKYYNLQTKISVETKNKLEEIAEREGFKSVPDMVSFVSTQIAKTDQSIANILKHDYTDLVKQLKILQSSLDASRDEKDGKYVEFNNSTDLKKFLESDETIEEYKINKQVHKKLSR